jgi:hypothetical protein
MKFRSWRTAMEGKLRANKDHFPTVELRKAYVVRRLSGVAYNQVVPGLSIFDDDDDNDRDNPSFDDGDDILDYLENIYGDPVRQERAEHELEQLKMKPTDKFAIFLADFTRLANDAQIPNHKRVRLLQRKVNAKLQHKLIGKATKAGVTFSEYVDKAHRTAALLDIMDADEQARKSLNPKPNANTNANQLLSRN